MTERSSASTQRIGEMHRVATCGDRLRLVIDFPDVAPGEPLVVSATLFVTYRRCADQALGRLRGLYPPESRASFKGGLAHRIFARHLTQGDIGSADFEQACRQEIGAGMNPKLGALGLKPSQLTAVIREVGDLYDRFKALSTEGIRATEVFVEAEPARDVTLRGSIDAVYDDPDGVRLIDWKTGGLYEVEDQLGFYAMLWALDTGKLPARVEAVSIGSGERVTAEPDLGEIQLVANRVGAMVDSMRAAFTAGQDQLERVGGPWCRFCPQLDSCSEGAAAVRVADSG